VYTNKHEYLLRKLLEALRLGVAGRDAFAVSKPDPGHLTQVITLAGGAPSRAIMVGDSNVDIAKRALVPSILVSFGYAPNGWRSLLPMPSLTCRPALARGHRPPRRCAG
jgi:phosphoglycolate phosphatase